MEPLQVQPGLAFNLHRNLSSERLVGGEQWALSVACRNMVEEEEPIDVSLVRGERLRELRQLALEDEAARAATAEEGQTDEDLVVDDMTTLEDGRRVLNYASFLSHQRYYDDLKHADCAIIDFDSLLVEQDKSLGKGGIAWDAAFVLGDYLLSSDSIRRGQSIVELGCGTGLCGLMLAAKAPVHVDLTDLPNLMPLLLRNIDRNFGNSAAISDSDRLLSSAYVRPKLHKTLEEMQAEKLGTASASVLDWADEAEKRKYDLVIGADVVASLYDPLALAATIHHLTHAMSVVYISFKERAFSYHRRFEEAMASLFAHTEIMKPMSRNHNPAVRILVARGPK